MRQFLPLWLCLFFLTPVAIPQHMKPPGITQGDADAGQPLEGPIMNPHKTLNVAEVKQESEELQALADKIPGEIQQVTNGELPKDLSDNLKKIEKLSKHLRSEVMP
ncbi:MAG TPA: hypothetical protein VMU43_09490 [Candidatus Acidoferrum sp.]|nr:hypothetical protein [Candidatus Acidoferrum sp.]